MDIIFSPAVGDSIQLETSLSSQSILLYFTAELTARDQNKLIQDHARIQLWSDLPHNYQSLSEGEWGALDFPYQAQATEDMSSSHKISLGSTYSIHAIGEKVTLFLEVVAPTSRPFSFTYRIIYPSGDIQWLGKFRQNGSLSFERSDYDLRNFGLHSWTFDKSRMAHIYQVKQSVGTLIVARVRDVYNYHVRAVGPTSFVSDLKEAALLFFVPRSQSSAISSLPTYVFSASPGSSLTLSANGHIIASGTGTLLFQANDVHLEPLTFIRQMLSHAELGGWNILAWDVGSKTIVLATKDKFPIKAVTIPFWHSKGLIRPIHLETTTLCDLLRSTEFAIFSPDNKRIHSFIVAPQATQEKQMVSLQSDTTGNELVMSPISTLQAITDKSATIWKIAILSPYQVQDSSSDDSGVLPTPPPSPHLHPIAHLSQGHSPDDTAMSSVPSLPSDTLQSPINGNDEPETLPSPSPPINPDIIPRKTLPTQKRSNWFPQSIGTMFRSFFFSFFFTYRFFWGHRIFGPLTVRHGNTAKDWPRSQVSTGQDDVPSSLDEDAPDDSGESGSESLVRIPETEILLEGNTETQTTEARPSSSDAEIPEATVLGVSGHAKGDVYYLQSDSGSNKTITIALLCMNQAAEGTVTNHNATSAINKNKIVERCVQFLDGSEPECVVSRCDVDVFYQGRVSTVGNGSTDSCSLLQYHLDGSSDLEKSERRIRISPPSVELLE